MPTWNRSKLSREPVPRYQRRSTHHYYGQPYRYHPELQTIGERGFHRLLLVPSYDNLVRMHSAKNMFDIHKAKLWLLLLVMESKFKKVWPAFMILGGCTTEKPWYFRIDMSLIGMHIVQRRPSYQPSFSTDLTWPHCLIVRIKQEIKTIIESFIILDIRLQNKCLKKPGSVPQMPLRWANVGHRLNLLILSREVLSWFSALGTNVRIASRISLSIVRELCLRNSVYHAVSYLIF